MAFEMEKCLDQAFEAFRDQIMPLFQKRISFADGAKVCQAIRSDKVFQKLSDNFFQEHPATLNLITLLRNFYQNPILLVPNDDRTNDPDELNKFNPLAQLEMDNIINETVRLIKAKEQAILKEASPAEQPISDGEHTFIQPTLSNIKQHGKLTLFKTAVELAHAHSRKKIMSVNSESQTLDETYKTIFLNEEDKKEHEIIIQNGFLYYGDNKLFDTQRFISHGKKQYCAYVIATDGGMYVFNHHNMSDGFAHSSILAQAAAFGAGELKVRKGKIVEITDHSGHYKPSENNLYEVLKFLKQNKVDLTTVVVRLINRKPSYSFNIPCDEEIISPKEHHYKYNAEAYYNAYTLFEKHQFGFRHGSLQSRQFLIDHNVPLSPHDEERCLLANVSKHNIDAVRTLIAAGVNPEAKNARGKTAMTLAEGYPDIQNCLQQAIAQRNTRPNLG